MKLNINFGKFNYKLGWIDKRYNMISSRIIEFAKEAGPDKYNRSYNFEAILEFAISQKITHKSIDFIYRHYVYHLLMEKQYIVDIDKEEMDYYLRGWILC